MFRRNFWKIAICLAVVLWAGGTLLPLQDQPFVDYAKENATAKTAEFNALVAEATAMTLEALRLGPKWAFRARQPLRSALAA